MKIKKCSKCKKIKLLAEFHKNKTQKDSHNSWCKDCMKEKIKEYQKQYRQKNKQKIQKQAKKYYQQNKEKLTKATKDWRNSHEQEIKKYRKEYKEKNKDKIKKQDKKYQQEHKQQKRNYDKKYKQTHKLQRNKHRKERRKTDINYKLIEYLRNRIRYVLKGKNNSKSTMSLIGCTILELKQYLKKKFKKDMSWDNYGYYGWHVDHIKPCASFDLSKKSEQKNCFHYTNLQPLWAEENLKKGIKYK